MCMLSAIISPFLHMRKMKTQEDKGTCQIQIAG